MKKLIAIALIFALTTLSAIPALADQPYNRSENAFGVRFITLEEVAARLVEGEYYPSGLLSVNIMFTEAFSVLLNVEVDSERVDYLLLDQVDWCLYNGTVILVGESVIDALVNN